MNKMLATLVVLSLSFVNSLPLQPKESRKRAKMAADGSVTVQIEDGLLRGNVATSIWNRTYYSFQNVPYAQPPVGDLRFKSPKPVIPWTGVRDATKQGTYCPQSYRNDTSGKSSEDCLYLNVYIPQLEASAVPTAGYSVMLWIHGGGFVEGSGIRDFYGPDNLMNQTIILVTINYRLGSLGFLNMEHPEVSSNTGMKDQVAALRWVKRNIGQFGGNPDDVTVFGESAGSACVELLLLSNITEGLFHRAISESGTALILGAKPNTTQGAFHLGQFLGYNGTDADELVRFLRSVPAQEIANAQNSVSLVSTSPSPDEKIQEGNEVFLTDVPETLLRSGKIHNIPYISGVNSKESKISTLGITQATLDNYNKNPEQFIPAALNIKKGTPESLELAEKIKSFYFGNKNVSFDTLSQLVDLLTDNFMMYPVHRSAMLHIKYGSSPYYIYMFTYDGNLRKQLGNYTVKGPAHADDLPYLFYISSIPYNPNKDDIEVIGHFTNMWVDFARFGDPSVRESVKWTPATTTHSKYLQIDVELSFHEDFLKERMSFWDEVYETYQH